LFEGITRMFKATAVLVVAVFASVASVSAQSTAPAVSVSPTTKLESMQNESGSIIVVGSANVGSINGLLGTRVLVESREITNIGSRRQELGLLVEVKESARAVICYVDLDEIAPLQRALDYLASVQPSVTRLENFHASYRTRGGLDVSADNTTAVKAAISIGPIHAPITLAELHNFSELLAKAKTQMEALKNSQPAH